MNKNIETYFKWVLCSFTKYHHNIWYYFLSMLHTEHGSDGKTTARRLNQTCETTNNGSQRNVTCQKLTESNVHTFSTTDINGYCFRPPILTTKWSLGHNGHRIVSIHPHSVCKSLLSTSVHYRSYSVIYVYSRTQSGNAKLNEIKSGAPYIWVKCMK
jgi:hypothetical protein